METWLEEVNILIAKLKAAQNDGENLFISVYSRRYLQRLFGIDYISCLHFLHHMYKLNNLRQIYLAQKRLVHEEYSEEINVISRIPRFSGSMYNNHIEKFLNVESTGQYNIKKLDLDIFIRYIIMSGNNIKNFCDIAYEKQMKITVTKRPKFTTTNMLSRLSDLYTKRSYFLSGGAYNSIYRQTKILSNDSSISRYLIELRNQGLLFFHNGRLLNRRKCTGSPEKGENLCVNYSVTNFSHLCIFFNSLQPDDTAQEIKIKILQFFCSYKAVLNSKNVNDFTVDFWDNESCEKKDVLEPDNLFLFLQDLEKSVYETDHIRVHDIESNYHKKYIYSKYLNIKCSLMSQNVEEVDLLPFCAWKIDGSVFYILSETRPFPEMRAIQKQKYLSILPQRIENVITICLKCGSKIQNLNIYFKYKSRHVQDSVYSIWKLIYLYYHIEKKKKNKGLTLHGIENYLVFLEKKLSNCQSLCEYCV